MAFFRSGGQGATGNVATSDVLAGKTFSNENDIDLVGTMPNNGAVTRTLNTSTTSYTIPQGYHDGSGAVSISTQEKTVTPSTSAQNVTPDSGRVLSKVTVNAISTQTKTVTAGTAAASVTPDSGKYLSRVTYNPTPTQEKTATPTTRSAAAAVVTPDGGMHLSKVTVNTSYVPNTNSATYTYPANSTGGTVDLGDTNAYRYVNAANVYAKGVADGVAAPESYQVVALEGSNAITRSNLAMNGLYILTVSVCGDRWPTFDYSGLTVLYKDRAVGIYASDTTTTMVVIFTVNNPSNTFTTGGAGSGTGTTTLVRVY